MFQATRAAVRINYKRHKNESYVLKTISLLIFNVPAYIVKQAIWDT